MEPLSRVLDSFRRSAVSEREKGTYFEDLVVSYLKNEATYSDLYEQVWTFAEWAKTMGSDGRDTGIDLVAKTRGTGEIHAIQCKFFAEDYKIQKADLDSFFTASGKRPFARRIIVATTDLWGEHAEAALADQQPPVTKITLHDLASSQVDWSKYKPSQPLTLKQRKTLRPHQSDAWSAVCQRFETVDRGKLIMACGTGKTFTSLKIAETVAGPGKRVLFLVPSLSLLSQTLTEWTQESEVPLHSFAVCSDSDVGKKRSKNDDFVPLLVHELRYPATTDAARLALEMSKRHDETHMSVVFSTYHSIDVLSRAQKEHGLAAFDLIVCDEAHRTTGATFDDAEESAFVKVHDQAFLRGGKRLYMTATPRLYGDAAKAVAERDDTVLCSMDDEALYGKELHVINFSEAVRRGLLVDYKVIVLAVDQDTISQRLQTLLADENNQLKVDDAAKIVGCWKALANGGLPMRRAVAFCQVIEPPTPGKTPGRVHKVSSKNIAGMFQAVVEAYQAQERIEPEARMVCEAEHVDGGMNAGQKEEKLNWLKAESGENTCRILSNVRCLSEGVDVPALDAVLFLTPRNSQVDVVQSVGRVMRNSPGKEKGYVILPVVIPAGVEPHQALNDNKTYAVVWQVLQALRSHDDSFDADVNKLELVGPNRAKMEVIAITDKLDKKPGAAGPGQGGRQIGESVYRPPIPTPLELEFEIGDIERAIYAKIVQRVGNRHHWEEWANDIAKIAQTHISRITALVEEPGNFREREAFAGYVNSLRRELNPGVTETAVIEMLAQHLITKPVFDALFEDYDFARNNPISLSLQKIVEVLEPHHLEKEVDTLQGFYESVKRRATGINNAEAKQKIVIELYDKFFRNAFPKMAERLGIVYTPVEIVDFILKSADHLLKQELGVPEGLGGDDVHIIDPFTGTGTFITRLIQGGFIPSEKLPQKYAEQMHANEIILLAYYIAAINIEAAYHGVMGGDYKPFPGILLTDTFQPRERDVLLADPLKTNSERRERQDGLPIQIIVGNPPYSAGQDSANDNNQNISYPTLDERIRTTYAARSQATNKNALYDSYIRAIRWTSDRIENKGVVGFVTNAGFLESNSTDGLRKCLVEEFSNLYIFHLRGNQRTSGELSRKEGGKVFGSGSRAPISISLLVKNPKQTATGQIFWYDVGDYLSREDKLKAIRTFGSVEGISEAGKWTKIVPDTHGDWINQRDDGFGEFVPLWDKERALFSSSSMGIKSNRDAWVYASSELLLERNMSETVAFYNSEVLRYMEACSGRQKAEYPDVELFINTDPKRLSWSRALRAAIGKHEQKLFKTLSLTRGVYRPFFKQHLYFDRDFVNDVAQIPRYFPNLSIPNKVICVRGLGTPKDFSVLICDGVPDLQLLANGQCFPLYLYDTPPSPTGDGDLFADGVVAEAPTFRRRDAITAEGLAHFQEAYPDLAITKEDLFYYIYGLLHSPQYREKYADNLTKELPRIPRVKTSADFLAFSRAGRELAHWHLDYESVEPYPLTIETSAKPSYRVERMRFGSDKTTVIYNAQITLKNIPLEAYDYVVNGKPALEWVMERQAVTTHKESGIVNDANLWATETMNNPRYPLELFQRVVTVSLETQRIVRGLPAIEF